MTLYTVNRRTPAAVTLRDPFGFFGRDLGRLFDEALTSVVTSPIASYGTSLKLDVTEDSKAVAVTAECPGVDEKDIDISFNDGVLTIKGDKKFERDEKTETMHLVERSYGSFSRSIAVPAEIDADRIEAQFSKGVLTIHLPKQQKAVEKAKKIAIKAA